jgi:hypothetical protein
MPVQAFGLPQRGLELALVVQQQLWEARNPLVLELELELVVKVPQLLLPLPQTALALALALAQVLVLPLSPLAWRPPDQMPRGPSQSWS